MSLGCGVCVCVCVLLEAGGQVGAVPVAVSWVWHLGAPRGGVACGEVGVPAQGRHVLRGPSM